MRAKKDVLGVRNMRIIFHVRKPTSKERKKERKKDTLKYYFKYQKSFHFIVPTHFSVARVATRPPHRFGFLRSKLLLVLFTSTIIDEEKR